MFSRGNGKADVGLGRGQINISPSRAYSASTIRWILFFCSGLINLALFGFAQPARSEEPKLIAENFSSMRGASPLAQTAELGRDRQFHHGAFSALVDFVQSIDAEQPKPVSLKEPQNPHRNPHPQFDEEAFTALRGYAQQIGAAPKSFSAPRLKVAEADNLFDALREFMRKRDGQSNPTPISPPNEPRATVPNRNRVVIDATFVGAKTCLTCHASQAEAFGKTLMGRIGKTHQGKFDCENCHGPGSAHVKGVGCAACHGEVGISKRPGIPSLVGLDPNYLVIAMKAYKTGLRRHELMKAMLSSVGDVELNNIAFYYARQTPARAQTPSVGDPAAGKAASAACAGCHGAQGVSSNPMWPSLAGQDARYLAAALKAYKDGSRNDATMKALAAALDERTINNLAGYYASLRPAQPAPANSTNNAPARPVPILVSKTAPADGSSVGGIISFRPNDPSRSAEENNAVCLNCHQRGDRTYWSGSTHETRGLMCTNCHTIMKNVSIKHQLKTTFEPDTCFQCHKDRRAQMFRSSHMPLREGKMVCSDCHNPHGSITEALLKKDSINDTCYTCHAEKRGPYLFEHMPVRENCLNCHDPHGSINEYSLKLPRPRLCLECHGIGSHGVVVGPNTVFSVSRSCQNCHTNVHGSNSPAGGAFQR